MRYNPPPNWPTPPSGWAPPPGWQPDPSWPPPPAGWRIWLDEDQARPKHKILKSFLGLVSVFVLLVVVAGIVATINGDGKDKVQAGGAATLVERTATPSAPALAPVATTAQSQPIHTSPRTPAPTSALRSAPSSAPQTTATPTKTRTTAAHKPPVIAKATTHKRAPTTTRKPVPTTPAPTTPAAKSLCGAPQNPMGYNFCGGTPVSNPDPSTCDYFDCIANFDNGKGYMEECQDHTYSMSGGRRGACSSHGGELRPVDE